MVSHLQKSIWSSVSYWLGGLQLDSTCPLVLGSSFTDLLLVFFFCSSSLLYRLSIIIQVFPRQSLFLAVCPATLGMGDTVIMGTAAVEVPYR